MRNVEIKPVSKMNLTIEDLSYGGVSLSLILGKDSILLHFTYVPNDPLHELLESALGITIGIDSDIILYHAGPVNYLSVTKLDTNLCRMEFGKISGDTITIWTRRPILCYDVPIKAYCLAVLRMFDKYVYTFSMDEYKKHWRGFPKCRIERLRTKYHELKGVGVDTY